MFLWCDAGRRGRRQTSYAAPPPPSPRDANQASPNDPKHSSERKMRTGGPVRGPAAADAAGFLHSPPPPGPAGPHR